jgi:hypothetical protein
MGHQGIPMTSTEIASASGWTAAILVSCTVFLPYLARAPLRHRFNMAVHGARRLMRLHYVIGFAVLALALIHMWVSMTGGMARHTRASGLYIATVALAVLVVQAMSGSTMSFGQVRATIGLRRSHFMTMLAIVALVGLHIALNSVTWLGFLAR